MDDEAVGALLDAGYRYALALSHDPAAAADLVQDAWVAVLRAGRPAPGRGYLLRAIRSRFVDDLRRRPRLLPTRRLDPDGLAGPADEPPAIDPGDGALDAALAGLRHEEREALELMLVEGFSATAAGRVLGKPRGTVLSLVHRAKAKLRTAIERRWRETGS